MHTDFCRMAEKIGQMIKRVAAERGLSQKQFGEKINKTKQGVASIYRRATIDTELLKEICETLNYDFFAHYYKEEPLLKFKQLETDKWTQQIDLLNKEIVSKDTILTKNEELFSLQRKYIRELEEKIDSFKSSN